MATAAVLKAGIRIAAARPTVGSTAARYITARSASSRYTAPRSAASRFTAPLSAASRFTAPLSAASRFTALPPAGGTRGLVPLQCASDTPPPRDDTPPPPPLPSRWRKLWNEVKPMGLSLAMFLVSLGIGIMASKEDPKKMFTDMVTVCEKTEKIHKLLSHVLPFVMAIIKSFW